MQKLTEQSTNFIRQEHSIRQSIYNYLTFYNIFSKCLVSLSKNILMMMSMIKTKATLDDGGNDDVNDNGNDGDNHNEDDT